MLRGVWGRHLRFLPAQEIFLQLLLPGLLLCSLFRRGTVRLSKSKVFLMLTYNMPGKCEQNGDLRVCERSNKLTTFCALAEEVKCKIETFLGQKCEGGLQAVYITHGLPLWHAIRCCALATVLNECHERLPQQQWMVGWWG